VIFAGTVTGCRLNVSVKRRALEHRPGWQGEDVLKRGEQVTFSGQYATRRGKPVNHSTDRCVFLLAPEALELTQAAPGIDRIPAGHRGHAYPDPRR